MLMNGCKFTGTRPSAVFQGFLHGVAWSGNRNVPKHVVDEVDDHQKKGNTFKVLNA